MGNSSTNNAHAAPKLAIVGASDGGVGVTEALRGPSDQLSPTVAADDSGFSLVWTEQSDSSSEVLLMRFDASGNARDATPVDIAKGYNPAVARRAGRTMIFWEDNPFVLGARIDDSETVPHVQERPDGSGYYTPFGTFSHSSPAVASTSDGFAIAISAHSDIPEPTVSISRFDSEWPDTPMSSSENVGLGYRSRLVEAGTALATAFGPSDSGTQVAGEVTLGIQGRWDKTVTSTDGAEPSIAYGAGRLLVAYRHGSTDATKTIRVMVFDATTGAAVGPGSDLNANGKHCDRPNAAFDGKNFWVMFRRVDGHNADIFGARVAPSGEVLDPAAFPVSMDPEVELAPALAANTAGRVLIAYSRFDRTSGGAQLKIRWAE